MVPQKILAILLASLVLSLVCSAAGFALPAQMQNQWEILMGKGQQALRNADYPSAEDYFISALDMLEKSKDQSPRLRHNLLMLTHSLLHQNYPGTTELYYSKLKRFINKRTGDTKADGTFLMGLDDLADTYESKGNLQKDPTYLEHALELRYAVSGPSHPKYTETLRFLSLWLTGKLQYSKAIAVLTELASRDSADLADLKRAKTIDNSEFLAFQDRFLLGLNYFAAKDYSNSEALFHNLLVSLPPSKKSGDWAALIYSRLAAMYLEQGKCKQAEALCRKAVSIEQSGEHIEGMYDQLWPDYLLLGNILARCGNPKEAESYFRQSLARTSSQCGAESTQLIYPLKALAEFLSQHNRKEEAMLLNRKRDILGKSIRCTSKDLSPELIDRHHSIFRKPPTAVMAIVN